MWSLIVSASDVQIEDFNLGKNKQTTKQEKRSKDKIKKTGDY